LKEKNMPESVKKGPAVNNLHERCLTLIFFFLSLLLVVSLFKNISYPLLWADESMTAMHGKRVLEYGYPKVHDGKNVVYDLRHSNPKLGIDPKTDAYIGGANWGMYYVAAAAVALAQMSDDFYTKTAILRIPFALAGLIGLAIFAFLGTQFFESRLSRYGFLTLFAFFELISIPLVLHLREARYYSLTVLLTVLTILIYSRYRVLERGRYWIYAVSLTISLFSMFVTFAPGYFVFVVALSLYESIGILKFLFSRYMRRTIEMDQNNSFSPDKPFKYYLGNLLPVILSLIAVSPLISFLKTFYIAEETAKFNRLLFGFSEWEMYLTNLAIIWRYFVSSDLMYLAIFLKLCILISSTRLAVKGGSLPDIRKLRFSNFLTGIFIVYFFAIARIPNFPFTRYFITLQPVLAGMIIFDVALVFDLVSWRPSPRVKYYKVLFLVVFIGFISINISKNMEYLKGHVYELFHQYKGPLDDLIPFIKQTYGDTDKLVIATNYEETSFMYYLRSKVIIGYVGNNLEEDARAVPDVIVLRKGWGSLHRRVFLDFFGRHHYQRVSFPTFDYKVNNIPELNFPQSGLKHQFRTLYAADERLKTDIYLKR
jgi:hypothetical protein